MKLKPYYQQDGITIYCGDCREILPSLSRDLAVIADPPYGINYKTSSSRSVLAQAKDFPKVIGDDEPFDPSHLLGYRQVVLWGANHYADRLPASPSWLIWEKRQGIAVNDSADCEMAWTNLGGPARTFNHLWMGMLRVSESGQTFHPNQKPVALMCWTILKTVGDIVDPYCGSGSSLVAAKQLGRRAVGIEKCEQYCEIAVRRLAQGVLFGTEVA